MRIRAVRQMKAGVHPEGVAAALGLNRSTVYAWKLAFGRGGGRRWLPGRTWGGGRRGALFDVIKGCDPRDYGFVEHLWTRDLVADLVATVFGVRFTPQWMGTVLRRLGLTLQRPAYRASEQDSAAWRRGDSRSTRRSADRRRRRMPPSTLVTKRGWRRTTTPAPPGRRPGTPRWWQPPPPGRR